MRGVKTTRKTIPPIVVSFHGMCRVIAWSLLWRVVASSAPTPIAAMVAVAACVRLRMVRWLWGWVGEVRVSGGYWWRRHGGRGGRHMVD